MLNPILFSDEITLWWEKQWSLPDGVCYRITLNGGEDTVETTYTHVSFSGLTPLTDYTVKVDRMEGDTVAECLGILHLTTPAAKRRLDVTAYGAVGDGKTVNTAALQRALDDCGADDCVYFPKGDFLTGALDVHSDTELYLEKDAVLRGTATLSDYLPKVRSRFEGIEGECYRSLLNIGTLDSEGPINCRNIVVRGGGSVLGGGAPLAEATLEAERERLREYMEQNADYIKTCENENTVPGRARGRLLAINNCENVILANTTFGFAASWNIHFTYSRHVVTYGCRILSRGVWNGDGWDPDSSEDSVIFDTEFCTHDNSIAIKSGKNPEGNRIGRPTVLVRIFHCSGGQCMAIGSEMSGGVSDVAIWDCDFTDSRSGIGIKVTDKRGGFVRDVRVRNCRFVNLLARRVKFNDDGEGAGVLPIVEDVLFENNEFTGVSVNLNGERSATDVLVLSGPDDEAHYFRRFTFDGLRIPCAAAANPASLRIRNVKDLTIKNITCIPE